MKIAPIARFCPSVVGPNIGNTSSCVTIATPYPTATFVTASTSDISRMVCPSVAVRIFGARLLSYQTSVLVRSDVLIDPEKVLGRRSRRREPRKGRNPKTGDKVDVPPKKVPYFKPGKELKELINREPDQPAPSGSTPPVASDGDAAGV